MYDLQKLYEELPTHPIQLWIKSEHEKKAQAYWEKRNRENETEPEQGDWVTILEAMQKYAVSYETVRRWTRGGKIPTKKQKGKVWVSASDLHIFHLRRHRAS